MLRKNNKIFTSCLAKIEISGMNYEITTYDLKFSEPFLKVAVHKYLAKIISPNIKLKVLMHIKKSKGVFFNPIKKVNYIFGFFDSLVIKMFNFSIK